MTQYNTDGDKFKNAKDIVNDFYNRYYIAAELVGNVIPPIRRTRRKKSDG